MLRPTPCWKKPAFYLGLVMLLSSVLVPFALLA